MIVDDTGTNLDAAIEAGWQGIQWSKGSNLIGILQTDRVREGHDTGVLISIRVVAADISQCAGIMRGKRGNATPVRLPD